MFCYESAANEQVGDRKYVWEPKSTKVINPLCSKGEKFSILPAFTSKEFLCQKRFRGSFNSVMFYFFVRDVLHPHCNPFAARHSVIIMDNA